MIDVIAERPFMLTFILLAFALASAYGWMQTGKRAALIVAAAFLLLIPVGIFVEQQWVTHRESLEDSILEIAAGLQANDHATVLQHIAPDADQTLLNAESELPRYIFTQARVNRGSFRKFEIRDDRNPPEAIVDFTVNAIVSLRSGTHTNVHAVRRLIVKFRKSGDVWQAVDYTHLPIIGDADGFSPNGGRPPTF